jgi:hypothetical protein
MVKKKDSILDTREKELLFGIGVVLILYLIGGYHAIGGYFIGILFGYGVCKDNLKK